MPISYRIDLGAGLIRTVGSGEVTPAEVDAHFSELSEAWPRGARLDVLLDLTSCTSLPQISQLRTIVSQIADLGGRDRFGFCAIVASRELLYGLLRVFEFLADQKFSAIRIFRDEEAAITWLREQSAAQ